LLKFYHNHPLIIPLFLKIEPTPTPTPQPTFKPISPEMSQNIELYYDSKTLNITNICKNWSVYLTSITFNGTVNWTGNLYIAPKTTANFNILNADNYKVSITANYEMESIRLYWTKVF
jgi:hypothetical protein